MAKKDMEVLKSELKSREKIALILFTVFTWVVYVLVILKFITQGSVIVPAGLWVNYLVILTAYVFQNQVSRWRLHIIRQRKGDWFVYLWFVSGIVVWISIGVGNHFGYKLECPDELNWLVGQIVVYYLASEYSNLEYYKRNKEKKSE